MVLRVLAGKSNAAVMLPGGRPDLLRSAAVAERGEAVRGGSPRYGRIVNRGFDPGGVGRGREFERQEFWRDVRGALLRRSIVEVVAVTAGLSGSGAPGRERAPCP